MTITFLKESCFSHDQGIFFILMRNSIQQGTFSNQHHKKYKKGFWCLKIPRNTLLATNSLLNGINGTQVTSSTYRNNVCANSLVLPPRLREIEILYSETDSRFASFQTNFAPSCEPNHLDQFKRWNINLKIQ